MGRPPLRIEVKAKDQSKLTELLSGGIQQVRVVLRALALRQLAKGISAPHIASVVPLTAQAIRNLARRYQRGGLDAALYDKKRPGGKGNHSHPAPRPRPQAVAGKKCGAWPNSMRPTSPRWRTCWRRTKSP